MFFQLPTRKISFIIAVFSFVINYAQNVSLEEYEWKNRIVVIISENANSQLYQNQLKEFKKDSKGFLERKLLVFDVQKDKYRIISYNKSTSEIGAWQVSTKIFNQFSNKKTPFKVVLIGLDGGVKNVFKNELVTKEILFTIIDGMFMRRQELKKGE